MDREKMVLIVVGLVLAVALLQAFQLSGLVKNSQDANKAAAASSGSLAGASGSQGLAAPSAGAGQQASQPLKTIPSAAPSQVGGC